jgi:hypothetical protein
LQPASCRGHGAVGAVVVDELVAGVDLGDDRVGEKPEHDRCGDRAPRLTVHVVGRELGIEPAEEVADLARCDRADALVAEGGDDPARRTATSALVLGARLPQRMTHFVAEALLLLADQDLSHTGNEAEPRAEFGRALALVFGHANFAADALGRETLPYDQCDIIDALNGALTRPESELA